MSKKYEFTGETKDCFGIPLKRIRALVTIAGVISSGEAGGWIESEKNLSQDGDAWVSGDARVYGNAWASSSAPALAWGSNPVSSSTSLAIACT